MSTLKINGSGAYERELDENWSAAYAKRLVAELELRHDEDKAAINASLDAMSADIDERATKTQLDDAVDVIETELEGYALKADVADGSALGDNSITNIKLDSDVFADNLETGCGQEAHKAVTPLGLKQAIGDIIPAHVVGGDISLENVYADAADEDVTSIFRNPVRDAGLREYSATPRCVGIWIDGTPIWRVVISKTLSAADFSAGYYTFTAADWGVSTTGYINLILNHTLALYARNDIEDVQFVDLGKNEIGYNLDLSGAQSSYSLLRGFVEFVTPAANIIAE